MDVSSFYTVTSSAERKELVANAKNSTAAMPAANFLDFILARLNEMEETQEKSQSPVLTSDNPILDSNIDMAELVAVDEDVREDIEGWVFGDDTKLTQVLALNQKSLENTLATETSGTITIDAKDAAFNPSAAPSDLARPDTPDILQSLLVETQTKLQTQTDAGLDNPGVSAKLQSILNKLQKLTSGEEGGLIVSNLTPEQVTEVQNKIEALLNEHVSETLTEDQKKKALEGIYLGLIKLIEPSQTPVVASATAASLDKIQLQAQMNNLAREAKSTQTKGVWSEVPVEDVAEAPKNDFANLLKDFSGKKSASGEEALSKGTVKPDLSTLQGWPFNVAGSIFAPVGWAQANFDTYGAAASPALPVSSLGTLTNLVTQAHSASQPHPATQMVAAVIAKAGNNGEAKNITLQLDPPELGRVEVRMSFGKDKTVKTTIVAEKPETFHMLQRDAHALERALIDSGLNADSSSLGFEMAHEGYQFNQQNHSHGSDHYAGNDDAEEIIETTMTWHVDPDSGHMRYNILA